MGVKWKTNFDKLPYVSATAEMVGGKKVEVGANWANAWLAGIHEY